MTLKPSKLNQIPLRNKDLAFGYLRENEKKNKSNYPKLIKYLVLIYSNAQDQFDANMTHKLLKIDANRVIDQRNELREWCDYLSFLKNVVTEEIHIWKFRFDLRSDSDIAKSQIGIWKTNSGKPDLEDRFIDNTNEDGISCTGYFITLNGYRSNPENVMDITDGEFAPVKDGDIIEIILDLNELVLTFKVNNVEKVKFDNIEKTSYRAVVSIFQPGEEFTLISYQDTYL